MSAPKDTAELPETGFTPVNQNLGTAHPSYRHPLPAAAPTSKIVLEAASLKSPLVVPTRRILPARSRISKNETALIQRTHNLRRVNPAPVSAIKQYQQATSLNTLPDLPQCWKLDCRKRLEEVIVKEIDGVRESSSVVTKMALSGYSEAYLGKSLWRLARGQWLNDEILDAYFGLLKVPANQSIEKTTTIPYFLRSRRTPSSLQKIIDTGSYTLYVPINSRNHWSFGVVSKKKGDTVRWTHFSSTEGQVPDEFRRWLTAVFPMDIKEDHIQGYPKQNNDDDCGLFVLLGIRLLSSSEGYPSQEQSNAIIPRLREKILAELLASSLNPSASEYEEFLKKEAMADILRPEEQCSSNEDIIMIDDPREAKGASAAESGLFVEDSDESPSDRLDISEQEEEVFGLKFSLPGNRSPEQLA